MSTLQRYRDEHAQLQPSHLLVSGAAQLTRGLSVYLLSAFILGACAEDERLSEIGAVSSGQSTSTSLEIDLPQLFKSGSDTPLTAYQSEEEMALAKRDSFDTRGDYRSIYGETSAPLDATRAVAEFEATEGVLISWSRTDQAYLLRLILAVSSRAKVWVLTSSRSESAQLKDVLIQQGVNPDNLGFFEFSHESVWTRDYGPLSIVDAQGDPALIDAQYYYNRRRDDAIPTLMARYFSVPVYRPNLEIEGGNIMVDGAGRCFFSSRVLEANIAKDTQDLSDLFYDYLGCERSLILEPLIGEGTGHIDMFTKLVDPNTVLLGYYRDEDDPMNAALLERNAQRIEAFARELNWELNIIRIPMPRARRSGAYPSYTNSLIVNDLVVVPVYPQQSRYESEALESYRRALGNEYQIVTLDADRIIELGGAVHCTTMGFNASPALVKPARKTVRDVPPTAIVPAPQFESRPEIDITDLSRLSDTIEVDGVIGEVKRASVSVDISHTYLGDLKISLFDGAQEIELFDRERSNARRLQRSFSIAIPRGYDPNRAWSLIVSDLESGDEGTLISWSIRFFAE